MNYQYFIGIDTSKASLDYCLYHKQQKIAQGKISNDPTGLQTLEKLLASLKGVSKDHLLFCVEHTGDL
jgi:phage gp16-like protein